MISDSDKIASRLFQRLEARAAEVLALKSYSEVAERELIELLHIAEVLYTYLTNPVAISSEVQEKRMLVLAADGFQEEGSSSASERLPTSSDVWRITQSTLIQALQWVGWPSLRLSRFGEDLDYWNLRHHIRIGEAFQRSLGSHAELAVRASVQQIVPELVRSEVKRYEELVSRLMLGERIVSAVLTVVSLVLLISVPWMYVVSRDIQDGLNKSSNELVELRASIEQIEGMANALAEKEGEWEIHGRRIDEQQGAIAKVEQGLQDYEGMLSVYGQELDRYKNELNKLHFGTDESDKKLAGRLIGIAKELLDLEQIVDSEILALAPDGDLERSPEGMTKAISEFSDRIKRQSVQVEDLRDVFGLAHSGGAPKSASLQEVKTQWGRALSVGDLRAQLRLSETMPKAQVLSKLGERLDRSGLATSDDLREYVKLSALRTELNLLPDATLADVLSKIREGHSSHSHAAYVSYADLAQILGLPRTATAAQVEDALRLKLGVIVDETTGDSTDSNG